uniref:DUF4219 domain-containing protein n=1 Tax=Lactuca sativa TaxID=4236 RepID=A0A9R1UM47_LACSA|nr:hypothetical protein LSAT_V11C800448330 [Lactuca sativa]
MSGSGSRAPILIPEEYNSWVGRMNLHLNAINEDVWKCVEGTYITPENMATLATNQATQTEIKRKLELQAKKELFSGILYNIRSQKDNIILIIGNKRTSVLNEFDNFKMLSSETIHDAHDRFNFIMVKMNNLGIKKTQHEINLKFLNNVFESWKMVKLIIQGNSSIHIETLYNLYGELQSYESSIDPQTTGAYGGSLALATSFQNQAFQSDLNDEADYQQLCALVVNTNLQRILPNHGTNHYARECRAKNKTKIKDSAYYAQRADELKKLENQEKQKTIDGNL